MSAAYIVATLVLCSALIFSYFTLKRILTEQSRLSAFGTSTSELRTTLSVSNLYLTDLKAAKAEPDSESRLELKISSQMNGALGEIASLKREISDQLNSLKSYDYYEDFNDLFNKSPHNIWIKLDQYTSRLNEISKELSQSTPGSELLWLPVEATTARNGALSKSYNEAVHKLHTIITGRSDHLVPSLA